MASPRKDKRFSHMSKDPRFNNMKKEDRKVKIDRRFNSMFEDKRFKLKYMVDKRGRPIQTTSNEDLRKYYELSSSDGEDIVQNEKTARKKKEVGANNNKISEDYTRRLSVGKEKTKTQKKKKMIAIEEFQRKSALRSHEKKGNSVLSEEYGVESTSDDEENASSGSDLDDDGSGTSDEEDNVESNDEIGTSDEEDNVESGDVSGTSDEEDNDSEGGTDEEEDDSDDGDSDQEILDIKEGPDYARGEGDIESSDDDASVSSIEEDGFDHKWGEQDDDVLDVESATHRLALCNMDWDSIKAKDLLVLLNSFKPPDGVINSITIYPSEFGKERMEKEMINGPTELVEETLNSSDEEEEDDEGAQYHREKLRQYQLRRMRYYYAVIDCDCAKTAEEIYNQCNDIEYESSATKLDLRFIPDEMTFDDDAKDEAKDSGDLNQYKPSLFVNTALQQSKVRLTWDETNKDRVSVMTRNFKKENLDEMDMDAYLASGSSDEGEDPLNGPTHLEDKPEDELEEDGTAGEEKTISKYRMLIQEIHEKQDKKKSEDVDMEISWDIGLKETNKDILKEKKGKGKELTPWEEFVEKKKNKKKNKKMERKKKNEGNDDNDELSDDDVNVDLNDPYFKEELDQMKNISTEKTSSRNQKKKKKTKIPLTPEEEVLKKQREAELSLLLMDEKDDKQHFSLKGILDQEKNQQKKRKKKKQKTIDIVEDNFQVNVDDSRFKALYQDPLYNIDPTAPDYKKTKSTQAFMKEKLKRRSQQENSRVSNKRQLIDNSTALPEKAMKQTIDESLHIKPRGMKDPALAALVKSVKNKTQSLKRKKT